MPAPTILINEDFESYARGSMGYPTNFIPDGIVFSPTFVDFSHGDIHGDNLENGALFGNLTKGYYFYGAIKYIGSASVMQTSVFYEDCKTSDNSGVFNGNIIFASVDPISLIGSDIVSINYQADGTITVNVSGNTPLLSTHQVFNFNLWSYKQINVTISTVLISGITYLTAQVDLAIDGNIIISTPTLQTNLNAATVGGGAGVNCWIFRSIGINGSYLDNLTIYSGIVTINTFPVMGTPNVRMSEGITEYIKLPTSANIRMTQGILEYIKLPTSANIRVTQMVIELIRSKSGTSTSGGRVYEA